MAPRDLWDLLQPTWVDRMGATAWDAPNLPLFEGAPWPTPTDAASAGGVGQAGPLYPVLGYSHPLPLGWPQYASGHAAPQPVVAAGGLAEIYNALQPPTGPVRLDATSSGVTPPVASAYGGLSGESAPLDDR
jgi:hypothetical protein